MWPAAGAVFAVDGAALVCLAGCEGRRSQSRRGS